MMMIAIKDYVKQRRLNKSCGVHGRWEVWDYVIKQ